MFSHQHYTVLTHNFLPVTVCRRTCPLPCGLLSPSSPSPLSVCIPALTMRCSRQCDVFRGCTETWLLFVHQRVMWKNAVPCSYLHVLYFILHSRTPKGRVHGKTLSMSLQKHFYCCDVLEPAWTKHFWCQPRGVSNINEQTVLSCVPLQLHTCQSPQCVCV